MKLNDSKSSHIASLFVSLIYRINRHYGSSDIYMSLLSADLLDSAHTAMEELERAMIGLPPIVNKLSNKD